MNKKIVSVISAASMIFTMGIGFAVEAADLEVAPDVSFGIQLVYDAESSTDTSKVINMYYKGSADAASIGVPLYFPSESVTAATVKMASVYTGTVTSQYYKEEGKFDFAYGETIGTASENNFVGTITLTVAENIDSFKATAKTYLMDSELNEGEEDTWVMIPGNKKQTVTPITEAGTKVVRHTDGLDTPAEYWVAELDPATATFNTIKVVATDSTGATAEDTKTITTLTGDAVISVHIAILNATNEVSKVDVTASYVE